MWERRGSGSLRGLWPVIRAHPSETELPGRGVGSKGGKRGRPSRRSGVAYSLRPQGRVLCHARHVVLVLVPHSLQLEQDREGEDDAGIQHQAGYDDDLPVREQRRVECLGRADREVSRDHATQVAAIPEEHEHAEDLLFVNNILT